MKPASAITMDQQLLQTICVFTPPSNLEALPPQGSVSYGPLARPSGNSSHWPPGSSRVRLHSCFQGGKNDGSRIVSRFPNFLSWRLL